jgi:hypothetical protein
MAVRWRELDGSSTDPSEDVLQGADDVTEVHRFTAAACATGTAAVIM